MSVAATPLNALPPRVGAVVARQLIVAALLQPLNAIDPMLVTLSGMVTLVRAVQTSNARLPMLVTLSGMVMLVKPLLWNVLMLIAVKLTLVGRVTLAKSVQFRSALLPISVTLSGMMMLVRLVQP
tara:strand:- start:1399 stop:1773 length:375 start_codon:yes stop_codon:yes gene_type:complete